MSFLLVTVPVSLLLAASLLAVVIHAVRSGAFDDWDGPAERHSADDDSVPEREPAPGDSPGAQYSGLASSLPAASSTRRRVRHAMQ